MSDSESNIGIDYIEQRNRNVVVHANAVDYDDIIRLFTHRHTSTLFKRQAAAFRQIAREKKAGLTMSDLEPVCRVIQLGLERLADLTAEGLPSEVFVKPLCSLIRLFGLPYIKKKAYEEFDNGESLAQALTMLGRALLSDQPELIHAVSQTIMSFIATRTSREFTLRCELVAQSGLVESLVLCLQRNANDLNTALPLVTACRQMATIPLLATQFTSNVYDVLINLLERDVREPLVLEVVQLLWLLLEQNDEDEQVEKQKMGKSVTLKEKPTPPSLAQASRLTFASLRSVTIIANLLRQTFQIGHRATDKQIRNDLIVLLLLLVRERSTQKLLDETGIFGELVDHATQYELRLIAAAEAGQKELDLTSTIKKATTVGLQKIKDLRHESSSDSPSTSPQSPTALNPYALTQDFIISSEDFQFKLLVWSLIGTCVHDSACHARIVGNALGVGRSDVVQVALLYLDTAEAFNIRSCEEARQDCMKRALQNQAMTGSVAVATATMTATQATLPLTLYQQAAMMALGRSKIPFSQLLQIQSEVLRLLLSIIPRTFESFVHEKGIERVLNFAQAILSNDSGVEEKRLNLAQCVSLQARALQVLVKGFQAGKKIATVAPVRVGMSQELDGVTPFSATQTASHHTSASGESLATQTTAFPNTELQELLSTDGDEAFEAIKKAMSAGSAPKKVLNKSASTNSTLSTKSYASSKSGFTAPQQAASGSLVDANEIDSSHVIATLLALFVDPTKSAELRSDAISVISLFVAKNPTLQKQFRQLKGIHILVQFLCNDGAKVSAGLDPAATVGENAILATTPSSQTNLELYAAKYPQLLLSVIDCAWNAIIGVRLSEDLFLALNGLDLILDLLLIAPPAQRKQLLGFLSDLLLVPGSERFLYEWRAGPGKKLPYNGGEGTAQATKVKDHFGVGTRSNHSSTASLPTAASLLAEAQEGFTALDLLLSFWPEASLLERHETAIHTDIHTTTNVGTDDEEEGDDHNARDMADVQAKLEATLASLPRISTNQHLRPAIYAVFARLGFHDDNPFLATASPVQRGQLFSIAHYVESLRLSALNDVAARLAQEGVQLVAEDAEFLDQNTRNLSEQLNQATSFQGEVWSQQQKQDQEEIERYLHAITSRKSQNEAFLISNARRTRKQTMRRRLLYKEMRQQMLRNSADESRPSRQGKRTGTSTPATEAKKNQAAAKAPVEEEKNLDESIDEDEDEDVELENRLLNQLESLTVSPSANQPIRLLTVDDELPESPRSHESDQKYPTSNGATKSAAGRTSGGGGKFIVSQLDPLAEQTLLIARQQQKERQAAISAALQQQPINTGKSSTASGSIVGSKRTASINSQTSQRTNTTTVSQLGRPKK